MSGLYRSNNGGYYYFHSNFATSGNGRCAWFGFNKEAGWANVFFGRRSLDGQEIKGMSGDWCDIPWASSLGHGKISIDFHLGAPAPDWHRNTETGGFGCKNWTHIDSRRVTFPHLPEGDRNFPESSLNGVWQTDTNSLYYMRELESGDVFWFAIRPNLEASHVAKGVRRGNTVTVRWLDIPPGKIRSDGSLYLKIVAPGLMAKERSTSSFGSSRWIKLS